MYSQQGQKDEQIEKIERQIVRKGISEFNMFTDLILVIKILYSDDNCIKNRCSTALNLNLNLNLNLKISYL